MERVIFGWDGFGDLMGVCLIGTKNQTEVAMQDMLEKWFEHGNGKVILDEDVWGSIQNNQSMQMGIELFTVSGVEIEITTSTLFDCTHYDMGD